MVGLDGVDNLRTLAVSAGELSADNRVRALDLMVNGLAKVVEKAGALSGSLVKTELGSHNPAKSGNLDRVGKDVLTERGAVTKGTESPYKLGVKVVDAGVESSLLSSLTDALVDKRFSLLIELLDAGGVNTAIGDEVLESHASRLATDRVEARENNRLGGIVNDKRNTGNLLKGTDIAPLATNDTALEVIGGNVNGSHRDLAGLVGSAALNRGGNDLPGSFVGLGANILLALAENLSLLANRLRPHAVKKLSVSLLAGKTCDALKLRGVLGLERIEVDLALIKLALKARELMIAAIERLIATIERLLTLHDSALHRLELTLALLLFCLRCLLDGKNLLFGLENSFLLCGFSLVSGLGGDAIGLNLSAFNLRLSRLHLRVGLSGKHCISNSCAYHKANYANDDLDTHTNSSDSRISIIN